MLLCEFCALADFLSELGWVDFLLLEDEALDLSSLLGDWLRSLLDFLKFLKLRLFEEADVVIEGKLEEAEEECFERLDGGETDRGR